MKIDTSKFKDIYIQESLDGLDKIESHLISLGVEHLDDEKINDIFRAAHSIKGGSGTFGFNEIGSLTHELETYLDLIRDHKLDFTDDGVDIVLQSVDVTRKMIDEYKESGECHFDYSQLLGAIKELYGAEPDTSNSTAAQKVTEKNSSLSEWNIQLNPHQNLFLTGNDPLLFIRELKELGDIVVKTDYDKISDVEHFDFESCYLSWTIKLKADCTKDEITEIFSWIEDDCDIEVQQLEQVAAPIEVTPIDKPVAVSTKVDSNATNKAQQEISSIRVNVDKIDRLLNMVGELVITQSMLSQFGREESIDSTGEQLKKGLNLLEQNTRELQECVMSIRMVPISYAFDRIPRTVYDVSKKLGKKVELIVTGEGTELDKTVMQQLTDPLSHMVRNSVDHGIEMPQDRLQAGKPETGHVKLSAYHQSGNIYIRIEDDGAGLNADKIKAKAIECGVIHEDDNLSTQEIHNLVFHPGLSTAEKVTDISGRGVGMDVVIRNIRGLGGNVEVESTMGKGSVFTIQLPLTLAIVDGQLLTLNGQTLVVPISSIIETLQMNASQIKSISSRAQLYKLRDEYIPIIKLSELFSLNKDEDESKDQLLVVVENGDEKVGLLIDELQEQQQVVLKSLEENYEQITGVSGATILGDGTIALILDVPGIVRMARNSNAALFANLHHYESQRIN